MRYVYLLLLALFLTACGEKIESAPEPGAMYELPPIEWRVVDRDMLERIYLYSGMELDKKDRLHGFVGRRGDAVVVYTLPPKYVDDSVTTTLGHEIMHVALGDYHK